MRHYTTIEQSKKLLELGIDQDTADMEYMFHRDDGKIVAPFPFIKDGYENTGEDRVFDFTPCWSVGALMELMPKIKTNYGIIRPKSVKEEGSRFKYRFYYEAKYYTDLKETIIDACYEMIVWLLENDYIKKI